MGNSKKISKFKMSIAAVALSLGVPLTTITGLDYFGHHDTVSKSTTSSGEEMRVEKIDLLLGRTELIYETKNNMTDYVKMIRSGRLFGNFRYYYDRNADGKLDYLSGDFEDPNGKERKFSSLEIESTKPEDRFAFYIAQKDYEEQMERFRPLLEEKGVWPYDLLKSKK